MWPFLAAVRPPGSLHPAPSATSTPPPCSSSASLNIHRGREEIGEPLRISDESGSAPAALHGRGKNPHRRWEDEDGQRLAVHVGGETDIDRAPMLCRALHAASTRPGGPEEIVIDVSELPFCDSAGLNVLIGARHTATEIGRITLRGPTAPVPGAAPVSDRHLNSVAVRGWLALVLRHEQNR
ncbi:STAS domain-containing protein [Streptomyces sp. NPDC001717]|uniref:STAS domain-containing protein n=1 Tax=Streptomyces sp. NPDC001717 TaxID=3364604 RepID=UPI00369B1EC8